MALKKIGVFLSLFLIFQSNINISQRSFAEGSDSENERVHVSDEIKEKIIEQEDYLESIGNPEEYTDIKLQWDTSTSEATSIRDINKSATKNITNDTKEILQDFAIAFGAPEESHISLKLEDDSVSKLSRHRHVRQSQYYKGLEIIGGDIISHIDKKGTLYQIDGNLESPEITTIPAITATQSLDIGKNEHGLKKGFTVTKQPKLVIFQQDNNYILSYTYSVSYDDTKAGMNEWIYFIDAQSGKKLLSYDLIHEAFAPTTISGNILPGEGGDMKSFTGTFENISTKYYLYDLGNYFIYNASTNTGTYSDANDYAYRMNSNWGNSDPVAISAAYNMSKILEFYKQFGFGVNNISFTSTGTTSLPIQVHYGTGYNNAFWYSGVGLFIGDGDGVTMKPLATLDIMAHEFGHAWTENTSDLTYYSEPGALNESFSDISGVNVEFATQPKSFLYPNVVPGTADWLIGEDITITEKAFRDMRNPANTVTVGAGNEQPTKYKGTHWYFGTGDNAGVHYNNSVQNFFYYLLTEGGAGNNDGILYKTNGIGITNASRIAYETNTNFVTSSTNYTMVRQAWIDAANSINPLLVESVESAWDAVGVPASPITPLVSNEESFENDTNLPFGYTTKLDYGTGETWSVTTTTGALGNNSLVSGKIENSSSTSISYTGNVIDDGYIRFHYRTSSEAIFDGLSLFIDGVYQKYWSGDNPWTLYSQPILSGIRNFTWVYDKDSSLTKGGDEGGIDGVHIVSLSSIGEVVSDFGTGGYVSGTGFALSFSKSGNYDYIAELPNGDYTNGSASGTVSIPLSGVSEGTGSVYFQYTDAYGYKSNIFSKTFFLDTTAPNTSELLFPANNSYFNTGGIDFLWSESSDGGAGLSAEPYVLYVSTGTIFDSGSTVYKSNATGATMSFPDGVYFANIQSVDKVQNTKDGTPITFTVDTISPIISEITPIKNISNDTTPEYIFGTNEIGTISVGGSCSTVQTGSIIGNNTLVLNQLSEGTYSDCTITQTDFAGNISNSLNIPPFTIDTTIPILQINGETNVNIELGNPYFDAGATGNDNVSGDITSNIVIDNTVDTSRVGSYMIHYNVTDEAGNTALEKNRTVNVIDSSSPSIIVNDDVSSLTGATDSINISVSDLDLESSSLQYAFSEDALCNENDIYTNNFSSDVTFELNSDTNNGKYICIKASDSTGNTSYRILGNTLRLDSTAPLFTEVSVIPTFTNILTPEYTFSTNETGTIEYNGLCSSPVTQSVIGNNTLVFNQLVEGLYGDCSLKLTDIYGNSASYSLSPFTIDTTPPILSFSGSAERETVQGIPYLDSGVISTDVGYGDVSGRITASGTVNTDTLGVYTIVYTATDLAGNQALPLTRSVTVIPADTVPNPFTFSEVLGVNISSEIISETILIDGINTFSPISMTGGTYSINGGTFMSSTGVINNGDTLTLKVLSSPDYMGTSIGKVTIGGQESLFTVISMDAPVIQSSGGSGGGGGGAGPRSSYSTNSEIAKVVVGKMIEKIVDTAKTVQESFVSTKNESALYSDSSTSIKDSIQKISSKNGNSNHLVMKFSQGYQDKGALLDKISYLGYHVKEENEIFLSTYQEAIDIVDRSSRIDIKKDYKKKLQLKFVLDKKISSLDSIVGKQESGKIVSRTIENENIYYIVYDNPEIARVQKKFFTVLKSKKENKKAFMLANKIVAGLEQNEKEPSNKNISKEIVKDYQNFKEVYDNLPKK